MADIGDLSTDGKTVTYTGSGGFSVSVEAKTGQVTAKVGANVISYGPSAKSMTTDFGLMKVTNSSAESIATFSYGIFNVTTVYSFTTNSMQSLTVGVSSPGNKLIGFSGEAKITPISFDQQITFGVDAKGAFSFPFGFSKELGSHSYTLTTGKPLQLNMTIWDSLTPEGTFDIWSGKDPFKLLPSEEKKALEGLLSDNWYFGPDTLFSAYALAN